MGLDLNRTGLVTVDYSAVVGYITNESQRGVGSQQSSAGTNQATATIIPNTQTFFEVTSAAASTGVCLPQSKPGDRQYVLNNGGNTITVYTNPLEVGANKINGTAGATGVTQINGNNAMYFCATQGQWYRISGT